MSENLKNLTLAHHENAERSKFANILMSGHISPTLYQEYLYSQLLCYGALESGIEIPAKLEPIFRSTAILEDLEEIESIYDLEEIEENLPSVDEYVDHVNTLINNGDNHKLLAHLYVRHFGDAHGGQIIKTKVPGSGLMYEFDNRSELIKGVRELLDDDMADEARLCFEFVERMFTELVEKHEGCLYDDRNFNKKNKREEEYEEYDDIDDYGDQLDDDYR